MLVLGRVYSDDGGCVYHSSIGDGYRRQDGNNCLSFFFTTFAGLSMNQITAAAAAKKKSRSSCL